MVHIKKKKQGKFSALSLFWTRLAHDISVLLEKGLVLTTDLFFLKIFSELAPSPQQRNVLLAALTAEKKMLVSRWVPPHLRTRRVWGLSLLDIVSMDLSTGRIYGAKKNTLRPGMLLFTLLNLLFFLFGVQFNLNSCIFCIFLVICVLHFVLFSTAMSCFSRHSVGLHGRLVGGGVWLQSGLVCYILCCTS